MKEALTAADRRGLELPLKVAADQSAADGWLQRAATTPGESLSDRAAADPALSPDQRAIVLVTIAARESTADSVRFATVKGLDDRLAAATGHLATQPARYRPGTLAALADAYDAAGATDKAVETRRLALHEPFLLPFAQASVAAQQRLLADLAGPERALAETIVRHQAEIRDPDISSTAIRLEVDPAVHQSGPADPLITREGPVALARYDPESNAQSHIQTPGGEGPTLVPDKDSSGHIVQLPDGSLVSNPFAGPRNRAGFVVAPVDDLQDVAAAGRRDGERFRELKKSKWTYNQADAFLVAQFMANIGTGGRFDHQRRGSFITGFEQLRQFRPIANVNVGLYCQQFGLSLEETLNIAGTYARNFSSNADPRRPSGLDEQTEYFIREGYRIGQTGMFSAKGSDRPNDNLW